MTETVLDWFINNKLNLTEEEKNAVKTEHPSVKEISEERNTVFEDKLFNNMPYCNITSKDCTIKFDDCATNLIKALFQKFIGKDTLVITSSNEHENVSRCASECKQLYKLSVSEIKEANLNNLIKHIQGNEYKNIFVYINGTSISDGTIVSSDFFPKLRKTLLLLNKNTIMTLDAVQEMFILPRDYRPFDYVIGTAHSLVPHFDMGMLISHNIQEELGYYIYNWAEIYLKSLNIVLSKLDSLLYYKFSLKEMFKDILCKDIEIVQDSIPHIFSLKIDKNNIVLTNTIINSIMKYDIHVDGYDVDDAQYAYIRIRWQQIIEYPEIVKNGVNLIRNYFIYEVQE